MTTLYGLTAEYIQLLEMAADPDVDPETLADTLEAVEGELEAKADAYSVVLAELEAKAALVDEEQKRLAKWKASIKNNADRIKKNLEESMRATGKTKFKTDLHSFSIQKNPASLVVDADIDFDTVEPEFLVFSAPSIDKKAVKDAIKNGQEFEWARLEQTESLRIR